MTDDDFTAMVLIGGTLLFFIAAHVLGYAWESYSCSSVASTMNMDSKYKLIGGCFVKVNDRFIPIKNYRHMDE